jgi:hypothetical protein
VDELDEQVWPSKVGGEHPVGGLEADAVARAGPPALEVACAGLVDAGAATDQVVDDGEDRLLRDRRAFSELDTSGVMSS